MRNTKSRVRRRTSLLPRDCQMAAFLVVLVLVVLLFLPSVEGFALSASTRGSSSLASGNGRLYLLPHHHHWRLLEYRPHGCAFSSSPSLSSSSETNQDVTPTTAVARTSDGIQPFESVSLRNIKSDMTFFYDQVVLQVRGGSGGAGATTFETLRGGTQQRGPPNGGCGGRGGHVIIQIDPHLNTLSGLTRRGSSNAATSSNPLYFRAEHGQNGQARHKSGSSGKDCVIRVPPGTIVEALVGNGTQDNGTWVEVARLGRMDPKLVDDFEMEVDEPSTSQLHEELETCFIAAHGGRGGEGNEVLATRTNKGRRGGSLTHVVRPREGPTAGERKMIRLTLQYLADAAIVGVPNAGKSTFLAAVTRAKPKIANYPFTTIIPNLGVWHNPKLQDEEFYSDDDMLNIPKSRLVLCDVPGLIDGASQGIGLGHAFLRHVELCDVLVHVVDATSNTMIEDYHLINRELVQYSTKLANKPQVVLLNKMDALESTQQQELHQQLLQAMPHSRLLCMSAKERHGVDDIMHKLSIFVHKVHEQQQEQQLQQKELRQQEEEPQEQA